MLAEAKQIDGMDGALALVPPGKAEVLAKRIVRAVLRGQNEIVYPRMLWLMRIFPRLGERLGAWSMRRMNANDTRIVAGGSKGDPLALEARERFERAA
jgi:hypothetical protein